MKPFIEKLHAKVFWGFSFSKKLASLKTNYQKIEVYEHQTLGRVLVLDGVVQLCMQDEFIFHESIAYWPFFVKKDIKKILIVGGGDLGTAIRLLQLKKDFSITVVDIDAQVTSVSLKYLFPKHKKILQDGRLNLIHKDAVEFVAHDVGKYDLIIVDSTDDCGVGSSLYRDTFITRLKNRLHTGGVLLRLSGSFFLQQNEFKKINIQSKKIFGASSVGNLYIPLNMYQGGIYTVNVCFKDKNFTCTPRFGISVPNTWYSKARHNAISTFLGGR